MYNINWDEETGGFFLTDEKNDSLEGSIRPVFYEELDLLGFNKHWKYPITQEPLLWVKEKNYYHNGEIVATIQGSGFFKKPEITILKENLHLSPIDIKKTIKNNSKLLGGLIHNTIDFIHHTNEKFSKKVDLSVVAFSGGKDSLVLLDLVQRALAPDQFVVIFCDTTMEYQETYKSVENAKKNWTNLTFHQAKAELDATTTWNEFGPPSRIQRWCTTVHKTIPTLLLAKELVGKSSVNILLYDGARREESKTRAKYSATSEGGIHPSQINIRPLLEWNSAEIYLYIFQRNILFNTSYRFGVNRVGCTVCPFNTKLSESIISLKYPNDVSKWLKILSQLVDGNPKDDQIDFESISQEGWKTRAGGRMLSHVANRVTLTKENDVLRFFIQKPKMDWQEWIKIIGPVHNQGHNKGQIEYRSINYFYEIKNHGDDLEILIKGPQISKSPIINVLTAIANKIAYCIKCKYCIIECPTGSISMDNDVKINQETCTHCERCLYFIERGCLVARSLRIGEGGPTMKGIDRYCSFGMRKSWLKEFLMNPEMWFIKNDLGNKQVTGMKFWLIESEILKDNSLTELGKKIKDLGEDNIITWAIIWINLCNNSQVVKWFIRNVHWGEKTTKKELIEKISSGDKVRTYENAINALTNLFKESPIGNELGIFELDMKDTRILSIYKKGWTDPNIINEHNNQIIILYSLYKYCESLGRYDLSLDELYNNSTGGPSLLFGISEENLVNSLRGISSQYRNWLRVELTKDLDNIYLEPTRKSIDVLGLL